MAIEKEISKDTSCILKSKMAAVGHIGKRVLDNSVRFPVNVSAPIMVTRLVNRQMENDLKFYITRMIYFFMIKSKIDTRNEFSDLKLARKYVS